MGIAHGCFVRFVAEYALNDTDVGACLIQMCGTAMTDEVREHILSYTGLCSILFQELPDGGCRVLARKLTVEQVFFRLIVFEVFP